MLKERFSPQLASLLSEDEWLIAQTAYVPAENLDWESRFCLVSGYMSSRGSEICGGSRPTLPMTCVHGVFDRSEAFMRELVNVPDWAKIKLYVNCAPIGVAGEIEDYLRVLDMRHGLLCCHYIAKDADGHRYQVESLKIISRAHPQCGLIRLFVTPLDADVLLEIENVIDGTVTNFMDYPRFRTRHFAIDRTAYERDALLMEAHTRDFKLPLCVGAALQGDNLANRAFKPFGETAVEFMDARAQKGETIVINKYAAIATGRDCDGPTWRVIRILEDVTTRGAEAEIAAHIKAYDRLWEMADLEVLGDEPLQKALRFNIFHLMSTPSQHDDTVNIGAKLMHGEEYGGHAFWDTELFCLPFFTWVFPDVARNLVRYRGHLLDAARRNARDCGYRGAKFPWESADTGDEECPSWTVDYDGTCYRCYVADYEHHVTAAVAYGLYDYVRTTGDWQLMEEFGLELMLETARFWASRMSWNEEKQCYEILQVTGPDEWHEPVDNNTYTNRLAKWNIETAMALLSSARKDKPDEANRLMRKLALTDDELADWQSHADKICLHEEKGLIEQFDGYFDIPDAVITQWDDKGMPKMPESCIGKRGRQRPILKQADVVMLMKLLPEYYDVETQRINYEYYEKRTLHRSSLSPSMHALMGVRLGLSEHAYRYLERSAYVDLVNNQGNTREGLHAASMGGTWQAVVLGYCGLHLNEQGDIAFTPALPENWQQVRFRIVWRGKKLLVTVRDGQADVQEL